MRRNPSCAKTDYMLHSESPIDSAFEPPLTYVKDCIPSINKA
jgi:hypothetical protein